MALSPNALDLLQTYQRISYADLSSRPISVGLHAETERVMRHYITYQLEQDVRAGAFLRQLRQAR
jgi:hypothetical protein